MKEKSKKSEGKLTKNQVTKVKKAPAKIDSKSRKEVVKVKACEAPKEENTGLSIDFTKKHIRFGANLVPTKIKAVDPRFIPTYESADAACADLVANIHKDTEGARFDQSVSKWIVQIPSRTLVSIDTGFAMQLPPGWQAEVSARSGWGKRGLIVTNAPGQIDGDYRGPLCVLLGNVSKEILVVKDGDRIGQIKPTPVFRFDWEPTDKLDETVRGSGGFGSTGGM